MPLTAGTISNTLASVCVGLLSCRSTDFCDCDGLIIDMVWESGCWCFPSWKGSQSLSDSAAVCALSVSHRNAVVAERQALNEIPIQYTNALTSLLRQTHPFCCWIIELMFYVNLLAQQAWTCILFPLVMLQFCMSFWTFKTICHG